MTSQEGDTIEYPGLPTNELTVVFWNEELNHKSEHSGGV